MTPTPAFHVIGAGPVGLAAALLLAQQGRTVTVHEARDEPAGSDENSYPIGVNARGRRALRAIDPALAEQLDETGETVAAFRIRVGDRVVSTLASGTVVGTTRARLTRLLLDAVAADERISLSLGHRLTGVDLATRRLTFEHSGGGELVVDAADARVVAADGVWSPARRAMTEQLDDFEPQVGDWGVRFRVLFSRAGASAPGLDPADHHIFTGGGGIYAAALPDGRWCASLTAGHGDEAADLLLSTTGSDQEVQALRAHVAEHAPPLADLLTDDDLRAFFTRDPFGGAVVRCPRVHAGEWLVLLGDAAHSVIPPTGEGVNAGLEDAALLAGHLAGGSATPFADYSAARMPDLEALGEYAWHLRGGLADDDPTRSATDVVLRVLGAVGARLGRRDSQVEDRLFGPEGGRTGYREAIGPWIAFRDRWTPRVRPVVGAVRRVTGRA